MSRGFVPGRVPYSFDVRDFGAVTNRDDNTSALQAALDAADVAGGVVFVPVGTWRFTGLALANPDEVQIVGEGRASVLQSTATSGKALELGTTGQGSAFGVSLCDLSILGSGNEDTLVNLNYCLDANIERVRISGSGGDGLLLGRAQNTKVNGCEILSNARWGVVIDTFDGNNGQTARIVNSTIKDNDSGATGCGGIFVRSSGEHIIAHNQIESHDGHANSRGILLTSLRHQVVGNVFEANNVNIQWGIDTAVTGSAPPGESSATSGRTITKDNQFIGGGLRFDHYYGEMVKDNACEDHGVSLIPWKVHFRESPTQPNMPTHWLDNGDRRLADPEPSDRIVDDARAGTIIYEGARGGESPQRDIADGDTTPDVRGYTCFTTANTGATTVTGFDGGYPGKVITIRHNDANTTYATSTGLRMAGNTDWTVTTRDTAMFVCDGTNWHELSRSAN